MPQAPQYTPQTDFSQDEANNAGGRATVRTANIDGELDLIATSINALQENQELNQRDDGEIRDGRVKLHTLAADVLKYFIAVGGNPRGPWLTATDYVIKDIVTQGGNTYVCAIAHTSGTFATDLAASRWLLLQLGANPDAASIPFAPVGSIAATNVQSAVQEVATEAAAADAALQAAIDAVEQSVDDLATPYAETLLDDTTAAEARQTLGFLDVAMFGASASATPTQNTTAINAADVVAAATGRKLKFHAERYLCDGTLYCKSVWVGENTEDKWNQDGRGTIIQTSGAGTPARWTDITGADAADFTPFIVMARSDTQLQDITVKCLTTAWSAGIFVPSMKRVKLVNVDTMGIWSQAGVYIDATWSDRNATLKALHPVVEPDTAANEFGAIGCFFEGYWGVKVQGTTRAGNAVASANLWQWGWGGTSDMSFVDCRFSVSTLIPEVTRLADGGGFSHDAQLFGVGVVAQGVNFVNCAFRAVAKYLCAFDRSNRITFTNCYGETASGTFSPAAVFKRTANTGEIMRISDRVNADIDNAGTPVVNGVARYSSSLISTIRTDGRVFLPNFYGPGDSPSTSGDTVPCIYSYFNGAGTEARIHFRYGVDNSIAFRFDKDLIAAGTDNLTDLGTASLRFTQLAAATATINTSDEREKQDIAPIPDAVLDAWADVEFAQYRWKDAVRKKGDGARIHYGVIAQRVQAVFEAHGIDPFESGVLCYDEWPDEWDISLDEQGNETGRKLLVAAGNRYGVRYEEAFVLETALMRRTHRLLESRLAALEPT